MKKNKIIFNVITAILILAHLLITYLWIFNWESLDNTFSRLLWVFVTILGFALYFYKKNDPSKLYKILCITSLLTAFLGFTAAIITFISDSMS